MAQTGLHFHDDYAPLELLRMVRRKLGPRSEFAYVLLEMYTDQTEMLANATSSEIWYAIVGDEFVGTEEEAEKALQLSS
tara:strand:+ start:112 stop:348 length:237 start_codon:yes stop_codon:yes gene_type:complete